MNRFVRQLLDVIDKAASDVHQCNVYLRPPRKIPTPYGGRVVWTMPGKNTLVVHLKDTSKIRQRKRWSQVCENVLSYCNICLEISYSFN